MSVDIIVSGKEVRFKDRIYPCAIGGKGFSTNKSEGDNMTPIGAFPLREVLYRADRISRPQTILKTTPIAQTDGWCDAPQDKNYNRQVKLPYPATCEKLWRDDNLYDVVVPFGYNDAPVVPGKGSAIFLHVAKPGYLATEGCVALKLDDLLEILKNVEPASKVIING